MIRLFTALIFTSLPSFLRFIIIIIYFRWTVKDAEPPIAKDIARWSLTNKDLPKEKKAPLKLVKYLPNLKPYSRYALYIQTYMLYIYRSKGAISDIMYFRTSPTSKSSSAPVGSIII